MTGGGPTTQHGPGPGGYPPPGPAATPGASGVPPPSWVGGQWSPAAGPSRGRGVLVGAGILIAILLAAAALVVAIVRQPETTSKSPATASAGVPSVGDTSAADKAFCEKVGPLLREGIDIGKGFVALGQTGTPERDAGIADYRKAVDDWANRIQPILDKNGSPSNYLARTTQNFVDLRRLYATNIRPGPALPTDTEAWDESLIAYGGPWETCRALGVTW
jgi:hypothetical protein